MDRGAIFTQRIDIMPGDSGSFVVRVGPHDYDRGRAPDGTFGFTDIGDLIAWLRDHAEAFQSRKQPGDAAVDHMALVRDAVQK